MAIQGVQVVGPRDRDKSRSGHEGGGKTGQKLGAAAGAIIGGATTGGAGAVEGAALGAGLGSLVGEVIDPSRAGTSAIDRRIQSQGPQIIHSPQSEQLKQSLMAMNQQPPEIQQEYMAPLVKAYVASVSQDNPAQV